MFWGPEPAKKRRNQMANAAAKTEAGENVRKIVLFSTPITYENQRVRKISSANLNLNYLSLVVYFLIT